VAEFMGASTICLTGLDLSFEEKFHAGDATRLLAPEDQEVPDYRIGAETVQDIFGEKRYTLQTFLTFRTSFENRIRSFPGLVLNATEGGLPVVGAESIRLADFIEEFCDLPEIDTFKILSGMADTEVGYNIEGLLYEVKEARESFSRIRKHSLEILKCIRKVKLLRKEKKTGDEFHRTLDRIERLTEKVRSPILNIIASYHYQLELYLKKQEMQDVDDIEDRWERLDAQLDRGLNYYGELVEAIRLFTRQLDALAKVLERERKIRAGLGDTHFSEGVRLVRAGREYSRLGFAAQAVRYLEQGLKLSRRGGSLTDQGAAASTIPGTGEALDARLDLVDAYITQFRFYEAKALLDAASKTGGAQSSDKRARKLMSVCKAKIAAWEERERRAAAGLAKAKAEYGGHLDSGEFYFRTKNFVRAEKAYTRSIGESRPLTDAYQADGVSRLVAAYYGLAHTHLAQGDGQGAVDAFAAALQVDPANPVIYRDLGLIAAENGNFGSAVAFLEGALELAPQWTELYEILGRLLLRVGDMGRAVELYEMGVSRNPEDPVLRKQLASLYQEVVRQGDTLEIETL
jgi:tetratricopeptide (TPR) repeat protein